MTLTNHPLLTAAIMAGTMGLGACTGDDGRNGRDGLDGADGSAGTDGLAALVEQVQLAAGNAQCPASGVRIDSGLDANRNGVLDADEITSSSTVCTEVTSRSFRRVATFPVCLQLDASCNTDTETVAEIVAASSDGLTLIYTDSPGNQIGFVDISDPENPVADGLLGLSGEPTSVAVTGDYVLVGVNTSADFINVSGELAVVSLASRTIVATLPLSGQPDSVATSPDGRYAAVAIENERDEDLGDGAPPQLPAGALDVIELVGAPAAWPVNTVDMVGLSALYPADPEPEYVDINADNVVVVTLQENNHVVLVDLASRTVLGSFTAGTVDLEMIDISEEDAALIRQTESLSAVPREPDGVAWAGHSLIATADEGDLNGGSRGFTIFNRQGDVVFSSGNSLDHLAARLGHYPDARSGNKGNEPENVEYAVFGGSPFLFVNSERSSLVFVYDMADPANPAYRQTLPAALGPEGVLAIPSRNLLIAASEEDSRDDKLRAALNIYRYETGLPTYPTLRSVNRADGSPIPWSAMSGLAADPANPAILYAIEDSFYGKNRIFTLDVSTIPATLTAETFIRDDNGIFAAVSTTALADPGVAEDDPSRAGVFDASDLAALINADGTVNIDPEGIAVASDGGFWLASEGAGTIGDAARPINSLNFLFKLTPDGVIEQVYTLPDDVNARQQRFGFEGVAEQDGKVYVAFQRVWDGDSNVRIGVLDPATGSWSFLYYPLDAPTSQNGGWVGLSDITAIGSGQFLVVERDNQAGPDAAIKRLYRIDTSGQSPDAVLSKALVRDLLADLKASGGLVPEKIEGSARTVDGQVFIINDNDGVDDNSGETQLLRLGAILN